VLLALLARAAPVRPDVARAWRRLVETHGTLGVEAVARELGCSRRHLAARFGEELGLSPKRLARVLRFRRAHALLGERPGTPLAGLAAECGYADQAHLTREFRALAGVTPGAFAASFPSVQAGADAAA
jgi:AraC-like DNA-binding protein